MARLPASIVDRVVLGALLSLALVYGADFAILKARSDPFGSMTVHRYYVMALKNQKMQFTNAGDANKSCVYSLLPHMGKQPCWYLARHAEEYINQ
jgi:hypothetical protein